MASATGRPTEPLVLSREERDYLELQVHQHQTVTRSMTERCQIILRCADGITSKAVAAELGIHENTVGKWRRRFLRNRIDGLFDEERPGRPRTIDDAQIAAVIERTLQSAPDDAPHWSIRSMAASTGFSHTTIRRIWAAFGLQPHRGQSYKLSADPIFVDKVCDIVGLYMFPPNRALALSVNEKGCKQDVCGKPIASTTMHSAAERKVPAYVQHGATSLFIALDVVSGFVIDDHHKQHKAGEFLDFLKQIDVSVDAELDIHIILDHCNVHKVAMVRSWLMHRPRYHVHFMPTATLWLRQVESLFMEVSRRQATHGTSKSASQLEADIRAFIERHSQNLKPYKWIGSTDEIKSSGKRFDKKTQQTLYREL
ncbi:IS630 family transposase [Rhizobium sp. A22-96]